MKRVSLLGLLLVMSISLNAQEIDTTANKFDLSIGYGIIHNTTGLRFQYDNPKGRGRFSPFIKLSLGSQKEYETPLDSLGRPQNFERIFIQKHEFIDITVGATICKAEDKFSVNTAFFNVGLKHRLGGYYNEADPTSLLLGVFSRYFVTNKIYGAFGADFLLGLFESGIGNSRGKGFSFDMDLNLRLGYLF